MGCWDWATDNYDAIASITAIASAVGVLFVAIGLCVSIKSLKQNKKAIQAQTHFTIQRFGFEVFRDFLSDPDFSHYLETGIQPDDMQEKHRINHKFSMLISAYNLISFQHSFDYIGNEEWILYKQELRQIMTTKGANDYFSRNPIENSTFDEKFKKLIKTCSN